MKFRKKPVVIDAVLFTGDVTEELRALFGSTPISHFAGTKRLKIATLEGGVFAREGDWIIRGVQGELYPCKPEIFAATYDVVVADRMQGVDCPLCEDREPHVHDIRASELRLHAPDVEDLQEK